MLKKENRIGTKNEFIEVKEGGKLCQTPLFGCLVLKKDEGKKFGWVISKKISKMAVDRNRIKRLLAETVRKNLDKFPEGTRVVFLAKKIILGKSGKEIEEEIRKLIYKV